MLRRILLPALLLLFVGIPTALADTQVVLDGTTAGSFSFNGTDYSLSPYGGTLGGQTVQFICVDQSAHVPSMGTWGATITSIPSGPFDNTVQGNQLAYEEMAYLASQMLNALSNGEAGVATAYQFAIWSFTGGPDPFASSNPAFDNTSLLAQAAAAVGAGYDGSGWEAVSPLRDLSTGQFLTGQEMLVQTPEPSSLLLLFGGLLAATVVAAARRQRSC